MKRRTFIQSIAGLAAASAIPVSCTQKKIIGGRMLGAAATGHLLRDKSFGEPGTTESRQVVIVGAGVSGLSAARHLRASGVTDFVVLELEEKAGGNAASSNNSVSAYPMGAHYVPVPNNDLTEYIKFMQDCGVITSIREDGLPVYNDYHLCFDPQERLYINGRWQDGIIPRFGVPDEEIGQLERFLKLMDEYRYARGKDGKDAFAIPLDGSSTDEIFTSLDSITMKAWLVGQGFNSEYLNWYVNYCSRDDYGTPYDQVSAWAGIHYFACRKGKGANAGHHDVLTWPEGNDWLVKHLQKNIQRNIYTQSLAVRVAEREESVDVDYFDVNEHTLKRVSAKQCIIAVPQFVAARLLNDTGRIQGVKESVQYVPWMVANISTPALAERSGAPLSWDNVIYGSDSLGYVEATHQFTDRTLTKKNLTYYLPLTRQSPAEERKAAQQRPHHEWVKMIVNDLEKVHPGIEQVIEEVDVMIWGHAMAMPLPGVIHGNIRKELAKSVNNCVHFAHTDLAGISIFEEAFYQGLGAAKKVVNQLS